MEGVGWVSVAQRMSVTKRHLRAPTRQAHLPGGHFSRPERPRSYARRPFPSPVALVRAAHVAGIGKRKAGPLREGETQRANTRGFAMDIKLIAKPLMVKTQQPVEIRVPSQAKRWTSGAVDL